ncbi:hypothetical protein CR513_44705, partial [Mucuna pruriens]
MGYPSKQNLSKLSSFINFSLDAIKMECYDICHRSKECMVPFPLSNNNTNITHGLHYFLTIVDDYSRVYGFIYYDVAHALRFQDSSPFSFFFFVFEGANNGVTPCEMYGKPPSYEYLRVIDYLYYVKTPTKSKSLDAFMLGIPKVKRVGKCIIHELKSFYYQEIQHKEDNSITKFPDVIMIHEENCLYKITRTSNQTTPKVSQGLLVSCSYSRNPTQHISTSAYSRPSHSMMSPKHFHRL